MSSDSIDGEDDGELKIVEVDKGKEKKKIRLGDSMEKWSPPKACSSEHREYVNMKAKAQGIFDFLTVVSHDRSGVKCFVIAVVGNVKRQFHQFCPFLRGICA